jgi:hypothetical protein
MVPCLMFAEDFVQVESMNGSYYVDGIDEKNSIQV